MHLPILANTEDLHPPVPRGGHPWQVWGDTELGVVAVPLGPHQGCEKLLQLSKERAKSWEHTQVPPGPPPTAWQGQPGAGDTEVTLHSYVSL